MDMDAFFASVEQLDHPKWRGLPLVVGGGDRGVVAASSYEARKFGIHSAMPIAQARKLCPRAIFTSGRHQRYAEISRQIMQELGNFSPLVEQASIDEAYLDASGLERIFGPVDELGRKIKESVRLRTRLSCSIGIAPVKFLAKIASDLNKPDGLNILRPEALEPFLLALPLEKIPGVGRQSLKELYGYGLRTAGDALKYPEDFWLRHFGKLGKVICERCRGIDPREVVPWSAPKSESAENTFEHDTADPEELKTWLLRQAERVGANLRKHGYRGRTITLKVKYADFRQITRSHSLNRPTSSTRVIYETAAALLRSLGPTRKLRLIGLGVSGFAQPFPDGAPPQTANLPLPGLKLKTNAESLFSENLDHQKEAALDQALDTLREKFGKKAVLRGRLFEK